MEGFKGSDRVSDHYDSNTAFANVLNAVVPEFEYPDWSHLTITQVFGRLSVPDRGRIEDALNGWSLSDKKLTDRQVQFVSEHSGELRSDVIRESIARIGTEAMALMRVGDEATARKLMIEGGLSDATSDLLLLGWKHENMEHALDEQPAVCCVVNAVAHKTYVGRVVRMTDSVVWQEVEPGQIVEHAAGVFGEDSKGMKDSFFQPTNKRLEPGELLNPWRDSWCITYKGINKAVVKTASLMLIDENSIKPNPFVGRVVSETGSRFVQDNGNNIYAGHLKSMTGELTIGEHYSIRYRGAMGKQVTEINGKVVENHKASQLENAFTAPRDWEPTFSKWRHGGWYVSNVKYPSGASGCVSNNYPDKKWRIACDERRGNLGEPGDFTFTSRDAAARAEYALVKSLENSHAIPQEPNRVQQQLTTVVDFVSVWDEGEVVTNAVLDLQTGEVRDIGASDEGIGFQHLQYEEIRDMSRDISAVVEARDDNRFFLEDLSILPQFGGADLSQKMAEMPFLELKDRWLNLCSEPERLIREGVLDSFAKSGIPEHPSLCGLMASDQSDFAAHKQFKDNAFSVLEKARAEQAVPKAPDDKETIQHHLVPTVGVSDALSIGTEIFKKINVVVATQDIVACQAGNRLNASFSGRILDVDEESGLVVQSCGRQSATVHRLGDFAEVPKVGVNMDVKYRAGVLEVKALGSVLEVGR